MYFIGVDVSKDKLNAACIDIQGEVIFETEAINNILGFRKILNLIKKYAGADPYKIGFESTGIYHLQFLKFCLENKLNAFIINPVLSAQATRLSIRPRKTDKID
ncbi:MAG: transposase [Patescibacteria group bacterium]